MIPPPHLALFPMTAERYDLMTAKPSDMNRLAPWAVSPVPFFYFAWPDPNSGPRLVNHTKQTGTNLRFLQIENHIRYWRAVDGSIKKSPHWPIGFWPVGAKPEGVGWCRVTESPTLWSVGILSQLNRKTTIFWINRLINKTLCARQSTISNLKSEI